LIDTILFGRRKANKSSGSKETTEATTRTNNDNLATYELASEVNGAVSLDKKGRLVAIKQLNLVKDNEIDMINFNASLFGGYSTVSPVQVSDGDSKSQTPVYAQVDKKRAARTAQHEAGKIAPGDGSGGDGNVGRGHGGVVEKDRISRDDGAGMQNNHVYANILMPSAAAAAESGQTSS